MRNLTACGVLVVLVLAAQLGEAEVLSSSASGFFVRNQAMVGAGADSVYAALAGHIDGWWDPAHTFSGDSRNLTLDARVGGSFYEALPYNGGVRHLDVVFVAPGKTFRMTGALGPLQGSGLAGSMTWSFEAAGDSSKVTLSYGLGGYYEGDIQAIAPVVDSVIRGQLMRLKAYVETGSPEPR